MDLNILTQISQTLGGITFLVAFLIGFAQLRQFRRQRRDSAAIELMRSFQDNEFINSLRLIHSLPRGLRAAELRAKGVEYETAAYTLCARFESIGLLVFKRSIPYRLVEELIGGTVVDLWKRLEPWVGDVRTEQHQRLLFEWVQWLADRLIERGRMEQPVAYEQYSKWKPKD